MARSYNHVVLVGNLGRDPDLRSTPSGKSVCSFSLATTKRSKDSTGNYVDYTDWHKIEFWGVQAESAAKFLVKGKTVLIEGEIKNDNYEKDGVKHYGYKVWGSNFIMMDNKPSGEYAAESNSSSINDSVADKIDDMDDDDDLPF
ncbi:MAG: hypothetical protein A2X64_02065 [Ignavibacteria bacterium GWF2_33_9]|nr:MAG: hypothetical protein A2X64_02065 [Ignavibacteria bacterium GWF2_33_9]